MARQPDAGTNASDTGGAVDPTKNVLDLVEAAVLRIDDMADLRARVGSEQFRRLEESLGYQDRIAVIRAEHNKEIRQMESDRVNSIRSVDVANAAATAAQLLSAVTTLATTAQATAETLRNQVAATAAAVASQTERVVNPIIERIALLEKSSYTGQGRDPQLTAALADIKVLLAGQTAAGGRQAGMADSRQLLTWLLGIALALVSLWTFSNSNRPQTAPVYVSPPATTSTPPQAGK